MLQHAQAEDLVKAVVCKGQLVDRGLGQLEALAIGSVVAPVCIYRAGVINAVEHAGVVRRNTSLKRPASLPTSSPEQLLSSWGSQPVSK